MEFAELCDYLLLIEYGEWVERASVSVDGSFVAIYTLLLLLGEDWMAQRRISRPQNRAQASCAASNVFVALCVRRGLQFNH